MGQVQISSTKTYATDSQWQELIKHGQDKLDAIESDIQNAQEEHTGHRNQMVKNLCNYVEKCHETPKFLRWQSHRMEACNQARYFLIQSILDCQRIDGSIRTKRRLKDIAQDININTKSELKLLHEAIDAMTSDG